VHSQFSFSLVRVQFDCRMFYLVTTIIAFIILFLLQVSPGSNCRCVQDVMAVNTAQKQCCNLGEISKRVVVVPNLDSIEL